MPVWIIEALEDRRLLTAASFPWIQNTTFNQFTGGAPIDFGYGVTDNSAAGANVVAAPKFLGLDYSNSFDFGGTAFGTGAELSGSVAVKVGIQYGYYVNGGTASLLHDGTVGINVIPPSSDGAPTTIETSINEAEGSIYTQSPTISAYADLVLDFNFNADASAEVVYKSLGSFGVHLNFDKTYPLFSINRQLVDADGNPMTNPDGSPALDGMITYAAVNFVNDVKDAEDKLSMAVQKIQKGVADKRAAKMEEDQAETPEEKTKATADDTAADDEVSEGGSEMSDIKEDSAKEDMFGAGEALTVSFAQATGGTLGAVGTLSVGADFGKVSVSKTLGSLTVTLPSISLEGDEDATGTINASTKQFDPGSTEDTNRDLAVLTVDPLALVPGLGDMQASLGPLSADLDLASYNITASLAVDQTVQATPNSYPLTLAFTDAVTGAPVMVTSTVGGVALSPATSVTYNIGQSLTIQPPADFPDQIKVSASLDPVYNFSNDIGLDIGVSGELTLLSGSISAPVLPTFSFGPLYTHDNTILDPTSLGSIYTKSFKVPGTPDALGDFFVSVPHADLAVAVDSGQQAEVDYSVVNPTPRADYVVTVANNGSLDATGVTLIDMLPSQVRFDPSDSSDGVMAPNSAGQVIDNIGNLAAGDSVTVTFGGVFAPMSGGNATSSFSVSADQRDIDLSNNQISQTPYLVGPAFFDVSTESDLRAAIAQVNAAANPAFTPIIFLNPQPIFTLTQGDLVVKKSVTISTRNGAKAIINGGNVAGTRIFDFQGDGQTFRLENLILENGAGGSNGFGGAINLEGSDTLSIEDSSIITSSAVTGRGVGGAIYAAGGTLNLNRVDIDDNSAMLGGALYLDDEVTTITNVNMTGNAATMSGSAILQTTTGHLSVSTTIQSSTFFNNHGSNNGAAIDNQPGGGGVSSVITYSYSAFSTSTAGSANAAPNFSGESVAGVPATLTSAGNNIASDVTGNLTADGDRAKTQAGLFLSGANQIASGRMGFVIGGLSLVWPGVTGTVNFNVSQNDQFRIIGNVIRLQDDQKYDISTDRQVTFSITAIDENNQSVGPNNTNFTLPVVVLNRAPTSVTVTSAHGVNEFTSVAQQPGLFIGNVTVADPDNNTAFTFKVDDGRFQVAGDANSGYTLDLAPGLSLHYLQGAAILIHITATDAGGLSVTSPYTIVVHPVPQTPTKINLSGAYIKPASAGAVVGMLQTLSANDLPTTPNAPGEYTYAVSDSRFEVVNSMLQLNAGQSVPASSSPILIQVTSTSAAGLSVSSKFQLNAQKTAISTVDPAKKKIVAGTPISIPVHLRSSDGKVNTADKSKVTLKVISAPTGGKLISKAALAKNGAVTFSNLTFTVAGDYVLQATADGFPGAVATITIAPAAGAKLVFSQVPVSAVVAQPFTLMVSLFDKFGNLAASDHSAVTLSVAKPVKSSSLHGALHKSFSGGIALFSNLSFTRAGAYALKATDPANGGHIPPVTSKGTIQAR